ncbi:MAG: V-type ATP synthase subunit I [Candidatus Paceibacterota bacterium]
MAILKMEKISVAIHKEASVDCAKVLQKAGVLEITDVSEKEKLDKFEKKNFQLNYVSSRLDFAISFLSKFEKKGIFSSVFEGNTIETTQEEIEKVAGNFYYKDIIDSAFGITEKININENKLIELSKEKETLAPWEWLSIPLSAARETKYTKLLFLNSEPDKLKALEEKVEKNENFAIEKISENAFVMLYIKDHEEEALSMIKEYEMDNTNLPYRRGTPAEELERIGRSEKKTLKKIEILKKEAKHLAKHLPQLRIISDHIRWRKDRYDLTHEVYGTDSIILLEGWCPKDNIEELRKSLNEVSNLNEVTNVPTEEEPPTCIRNTRLMRPFEPITYLYGVPTSKDLDPTPYLAGFFFIFFGFCLSDVGYGILLALITGIALFKYNIPRDMALFLKLFLLSGIASLLGGMIFGGYAGVETSMLPEWLQKINMFNPLEDPLPIFMLSLILGIIQLLTGMVLAIVRDARNGILKEGILNNGPWLSLFIFLGAWIASLFEFLPKSTEDVWFFSSLASVTAIILTAGRKQKNPFAKLFMGLTGLYESVNYLSDILSYSRLLAIGLATSALAFSINLIAMMAYEGIPYIGWLIFLMIIIIGHFFNFIVNLLGAFVHTARLQFVEFFGKFIIGTGRAFNPFSRKSNHVIIREKVEG